MEYFFNFDKIAYLKGERPKGCILCLIRDHSPEVKNLTVFENHLFNVSINLYPYNPGHLLLFPLRHIKDLRELSENEEGTLNRLTRVFLDILESTHSPTAFNLGYNMGTDAGGSIDHLHYHIIPRYPRETGIADLLAAKRVLVEDPLVTAKRLRKAVEDYPRSILTI